MNLLKEYPYILAIQKLAKKKKREVYLVGGFLRDYRLGMLKNDFDFAVSKGAIEFARTFSNEIKGVFILLDQKHGCARVAKKEKGQLYTFDFADYRGKTLEDDLKLRDFTVNTLSVSINDLKKTDLLDSCILDVGGGKKGLEEKIIKRVSASAFRDDPLRMLRAFSMRANLGFEIQPITLKQIEKEKDLISQVSEERIREEFFKVLESERAFTVLTEMDRIGLLEKVIPQIRLMYDCKQGGYHHLDVWPHSLEVVHQMEEIFKTYADHEDIAPYLKKEIAGNRSRKALMKLGALLHDIGKPDTRKKEAEGKLSFHGHERVGRNITRSITEILKVSTRERHALEDYVFFHLRPGYLSNFKLPSEKSIYRYFRDTKDEAVAVLLLSLADQRSTCGPLTSEEDQKHHEDVCLTLVDRFFQMQKKEPFIPLITGKDLIRSIKLTPSPLFKDILSQVEEKQVLGELKTKKEALNFARTLIKK